LPVSTEKGADSLWGPINSAHSDFMLLGGGALAANPPSADTGAASNVPLPSAPKPAGNEPAPSTAASTFAKAAALPNTGPTGPKKS
jgi:hypothetical protein